MEIEPDDEDEDVSMTASSSAAVEIQTVPDDVELPCGCHFHWFGVSALGMIFC